MHMDENNRKDGQSMTIFSITERKTSIQAPVVQRLDNAIHRINRYPADKC